MKEIYDWVPWFRELAKRIEEGGKADLIEKAKAVDWGKDRSLLDYGDENIDPFSFFYFLAQKNTVNQWVSVYGSVNKVFKIAPKPPKMGWDHDNTSFQVLLGPGVCPIRPVFHNGKRFNPASLWELFRQAVKDEPDVDAKTFHEVLDIPQVGVAKLTQCLFLINPRYFIPIDGYFPGYRVIKKWIKGPDSWNVCLELINETKQQFPGCSAYEIGRVFFLLKKSRISLSRNFISD